MSDDKKPKSIAEQYEHAVRTGEPLLSWPILEITEVLATAMEVRIRFLGMKTPDNRAIVTEILMSLETAATLKSELAKYQNIPDTQPLRRASQAKH